MDECTEYPLQWLVGSDRFYHQVQAKLKDPNEKDAKGYSLLHIAAQSREDNSRVVQLLLDRGGDVDSITPHGHNPLHFAVSSRKRDTVVALIEAGASVNSKDLLGRTALHFSVCKGQSYPPCPVLNMVCDMWIVERLLCHPEITPNPVDERGETPLMWAVKERYLNAVEELLKKGANPNIPNQNKRTPLHETLSSRNPSDDIVSFLLTSGAGIYCEDNLGQTPVGILVRNTREDDTLFSAVRWVKLIVLRYHIKESFESQLRSNPVLFIGFKRCCEEIMLMKRLIIYDDVTLHDFALDCFQWTVEDPTGEICVTMVVELLLSGFYIQYFEFLLHRISWLDLLSMLERTVGSSVFSRDPVPPDASHLIIFNEIVHFYDGNGELRKRLCKIIGILKTFYEKLEKNNVSFLAK
ncbi:Ankyrin-3 [Araneus ventricosus]|uniref:Alpha-latrotoxin n=1 Tax=Araneus ventricosus TaxID=182803 RepID=A0A4Y2BQQ7_ARAVE|nr:Ankyrin-3 [Araneus ventricosus]